MRKLFTGITVAGAMLLGLASSASAASFTFDFCPAAGTECTEDSITKAQVKFDEILSGTDPNDYNVTLTITGGDAGFIDELLLSIGNLKYPSDFASVGAITSDSAKPYSGPANDNIPGCGGAPLSGNDFCFFTPGNGDGEVSGSGITNTFTFTVNLNDAAPAITASTGMNFRFELENSTGGNLGIFSPEGQYNTTTTSTTSTTTTTTSTTTNNTTTSPSTVPEPGILALLGAGFGAAAQRLRRRRNG
jgi:hypothetical protein